MVVSFTSLVMQRTSKELDKDSAGKAYVMFYLLISIYEM